MIENKIAIAREQQIFAVLESERGVAARPTPADYLIAAGYGSINQQPSFSNSKEIHNSRDIMDRFGDQVAPGSWSFPVYLRPSGSLGVVPQEAVLMTSLLGKKTVNTGASVVFEPDIEKPSFTLYVKKDHTVFFGTGATAGSGKLQLATKGAATVDFSGKFMRLGWAGTSETTSGATSGDTTIEVDDARKYTVDALVEIELADGTVYNNSDTGYKISARNTDTNTITLEALEDDVASGSIVRCWLPVGVEVGAPLPARKGSAEMEGNPRKVQKMEITISDDPKYLDEEITDSGFTEDYAENQRSVAGSMSVFYRVEDITLFDDGLNDVEKALKMIIGDTAGSIVEVSTSRTSISVPNISEADPTVALSTSLQALGTNGEDSVTITYK